MRLYFSLLWLIFLQPPNPRGGTLAARLCLPVRPTFNLEACPSPSQWGVLLGLPSPLRSSCACWPLGTGQEVAQQSGSPGCGLHLDQGAGSAVLGQGDVGVLGGTFRSRSRRFLPAPSLLRPQSSQISILARPVLLESSRVESCMWSNPLAPGPGVGVSMYRS